MLNHEIKYFNQDIWILLWFSIMYVFLSSLRLITSGYRKLDSVVLNKSVTISFQFCFFQGSKWCKFSVLYQGFCSILNCWNVEKRPCFQISKDYPYVWLGNPQKIKAWLNLTKSSELKCGMSFKMPNST